MRRVGSVLMFWGVLTVGLTAQIGGKPATGNPTPGTPQPDPPNLADRIALIGCVQLAQSSNENVNAGASDAGTPSDFRFVLANAERQKLVPTGTGGSALAESPSSRMYRLRALESQLSAFVGARVEISGEVLASPADGLAESSAPPTLQVEFVQRVAAACP